MTGMCERGAHCPFRHVKGDRVIVCKHWLRHLCKKGDDCEFLHEYDMTKMPICYFFQKFGECNNKECQYMHVDADSMKIRECSWYDRGFCKHGELLRRGCVCVVVGMDILIVLLPLSVFPQDLIAATSTPRESCVRTTCVASAPRAPAATLSSRWRVQ